MLIKGGRIPARLRAKSSLIKVAGVLGLGFVLAMAGVLRPRRVLVSGRSMEPTLTAGDRLLVLRTRRLKAGDVVAMRHPHDPRRVIVKRAAAVRRGEVVVRGDNPEASTDSRSFGPVANEAVLGKVVRRYAPKGRTGHVR